ncbi:MAG: DNA primase, partial [bacterium]|nr:DNA primase [bacterium]
SIFQDIIVDEIKGFPILFLQGKTSSGKDQLANCCQSLFGKPQSAINIEAGNSTAKAHIRELAQFINIISQFSEYKNGDKLLDGMLKGIWDRNGYKRGTIESHVSTETIPILSSLILTSNNTPDDDALITRLLWVDMSKNDFSKDEINKYDELAEMTKEGVSCFTDNLLQFRKEYLLSFRIKYRQYKDIISEKLPKTAGRISTNYAILGATYEIFKDKIIFPFTYNEMIEEFLKCSQFQINKINSASVTNKWWDCFLACIKVNGDNKIDFDRDIKLEQNNLYFNFSNVYNKIQRQWYNQYKETMPSKTTMQETIKKDSAFIEIKNSYRIKTGNDGSNTSAYVIDINKTSISDEIIEELHFRNTPV